MRLPQAHRLAAWVLLVVVMAAGLWRVENTANNLAGEIDRRAAADERATQEDCERVNNSREEIITAILETIRVLVERNPPRDEEHRQDREEMLVEVTIRLEETLPDRDCEKEARERARIRRQEGVQLSWNR